MENLWLWAKVWFSSSGVVLLRVLLVKIGLTHQNFANHPFFLHFLRRKDPCTWWIKNLDMDNWFEPSIDLDLVVWEYNAFCQSRLGFTHQNFTNSLFIPCLLRKKDPCTWWIRNIYMAN
jgi:hypothetical protein